MQAQNSFLAAARVAAPFTGVLVMTYRNTMAALAVLAALGLSACAPPADEQAQDPAAEQAATEGTEKTAAETAAIEPEPEPEAKPEEKPAPPKPRPAAPKPRPAPEPPPVCQDCGVVSSIEPVKEKAAGSGAGAVLGAIAGGVIGHQFGGGSGKDVATAAGAIAGGYAGHQAERQIRANTYYRVGVKMDNGGHQSVNVNDPAGISVGTPVRVVGGNLQLR